MDGKLSALNGYFEEQIRRCAERREALLADERGDEANFEKVRSNVFDIFRTVLSAAERQGKGDPEAVRRFFWEKTEQIPSSWAAACEKAREHGDPVRLRIEQIKLDAIGEIRDCFARIWEEEP